MDNQNNSQKKNGSTFRSRAERKKDKELKALSSNNNDHVGNKDKKKNSKPSSNRQTSHLKLHDAVTIEDAIRHTSRHVNRHGKLHCKQLCAFWSRVASLISVSPNWKCDARSKPRYKQQLNSILTRTVNMIYEFGPRELVGTILGMAKVVKHVPQLGDDWRIELFHELLDGYEETFMSLAIASCQCLQKCNDQSIINLVYAYATIEYVPVFQDGSTLFGHIEYYAIRCMWEQNESHGMSTILWAYAKAGVSSPYLFGAATDIIFERDLSQFLPHVISSILWAYATAEEPSSDLFVLMADAIIASDISTFNPQQLKDIVWSYAKVGISAPAVFNIVGDASIEKMKMDLFTSQELSNMAWAFATAKECHQELFHFISIAAIEICGDFNPQEISILLWAYATLNIIDKGLFLSFASTAELLIEEEFEIQNLANIAWAFSVANVAAPNLFDQRFVNAVHDKENEMSSTTLAQFHQWHLWQAELKTGVCLSPTIQRRCYEAFVNNEIQISDFQLEVMSELKEIGFYPEEEVLLPSGYSLDILVQVDGQNIGVEVDGPYHFIGREPLGKTILKRRQVISIDGIPIVSLPFWAWQTVGHSGARKKEYLRRMLLGIESDTIMSTADANAIMHQMAEGVSPTCRRVQS